MIRVGTLRYLTLAAAVVALTGVAYAQSFELKTGQWEFTMSGINQPPGDMSKLPPNVRAQVEARMKKPITYKSCVTTKDLQNLSLGNPDDEDDAKDCKVTTKKVTASTADVVKTCTGETPRTETVHFEAPSRESMRGTIKIVSKARSADMTVAGKWIGAVCKEE